MQKIFSSKSGWFYLLIVLLVINIGASFWSLRFDLSSERKYTLSAPVKQMLRNVHDEVNIDIYLQGNLKSGLRKLRNSTEAVLQDFNDYADGNIHYRFVDPVAGGDDTTRAMILDSLSRMGIQPMTVVAQAKKGEEQSQRIVIPAAMVKYKNKVFPVDLLKGVQRSREGQSPEQLYLNAETLLEYKFANAIDKLVRDSLPFVGYLMGNGEPLDFRVYALINYLRGNFRFGIVRLDSVPVIPDQLNALIMVKPSLKFSDGEKRKLDQFVMRGGSLVCMIDNLYAESDSLKASKEVIAYDRGLNLDDLLFHYGVRINQDLVEDMQNASINLVVGSQGGKPQLQLMPWPYYPLLDGNPSSSISKNLDPVFSRFANSVDTVNAPGIRKSILLQSSPNARTISTPAMITLESIKTAGDPRTFDKQNIPVAVLLEGKFSSLYANRISAATEDSLARIFHQPFLRSGEKTARVIVCADADVVMNELSERGPLPLGFSKDINYTFANTDFLENCLDYCVSPSGILEARSKNYTLRLLDPEKTEENKTFWQMVNIAGPLLVILLCGVIFQFIRKRKYSIG
ncbi:MAG: gliding motility-associated ABC transporter substrate-binding protein GldG [Bacteroidota bacterium]|nr:gliding motility-associated ABC transporter substrate-binding protein GldG [Bacteroidota bacterium]MDP4211145.1 gliding motility-associated ABC transporter substrate-binding protein GldG [Bacteroidota bacterium]MDP4249456.1 gliding motility-associated ABC transporter substrate-binding protein GldG [Bacteroidota bacterium]